TAARRTTTRSGPAGTETVSWNARRMIDKSTLCARCSQPVHGEALRRVAPHCLGHEARLARQRAEAVDGVLVRVLGVQRLAVGKIEALAGHMHGLRAAAH